MSEQVTSATTTQAEPAAAAASTPAAGGTPTTHVHSQLSKDAVMYFSRQLALFDESITSKLHTFPAQVKSIEAIKVLKVTHLRDFIKDAPSIDNEFRRIRYQLSNKQKQQQQQLSDELNAPSHQHHTTTSTTTTTPTPSAVTSSGSTSSQGASAGSSTSTTAPTSATGNAVNTVTSQEETPRTLFRPTYNRYVRDDEYAIIDNVRSGISSNFAFGFPVAGPREKIVWKPGEVKACIVTCGGLCPGLNNVIQELFYCLHYNYGVDTIYGIRSGYRGFWQPQYQPWLRLTPDHVEKLHEQGGSMLGSSRGGFDAVKMVNALEVYGVNQVYVIGGDGTHRGAWELHCEATRRGIKLAVACVPKTIDNDIGVIDRSFGFNTAVAEARRAILSAAVTAKSTANSVAVVKLMGRHAGYIAAHATISARSVDACLIPEVPMNLHGSGGLLRHIQRIAEQRGNAVIVVAEGAGEEWFSQPQHDLVYDTQHSSTSPTQDDDRLNAARVSISSGGLAHGEAQAEFDASGNKKLQDIGQYLCEAVQRNVRVRGQHVNVIYTDPSYTIRSVCADAEDAVLCLFLATNAVHGAMAGFTGFSSATVNGRNVMIPIEVIVQSSPSYMNPRGSTWQTVLNQTHQPHLVESDDDDNEEVRTEAKL